MIANKLHNLTKVVIILTRIQHLIHHPIFSFFSKAEEANANVHTGSDVFFDLFDQHQEGEATFDVKL